MFTRVPLSPFYTLYGTKRGDVARAHGSGDAAVFARGEEEKVERYGKRTRGTVTEWEEVGGGRGWEAGREEYVWQVQCACVRVRGNSVLVNCMCNRRRRACIRGV